MKPTPKKHIGKNEVLEIIVDPKGKTEAQIKEEAHALAEAEVQKTFRSDMSELMKNVKLKTKLPSDKD
jgi:hypothetical protein